MEHSKAQEAKRLFFTYRNGMLADYLRQAGDSHKVIFGLNLPQISDIARQLGQDAATARELWNNSTSRESRLLAPLLIAPADMPLNEARQWIESIENTEIADNLCHKLLRKLPQAETLIYEYADSHSNLLRYTALRLAINLQCIGAITDDARLKALAQAEAARNLPLTLPLCHSILE